MFINIFDSTQASLSIAEVLICVLTPLSSGLIIALAYMFSGKHTKSFAITLVILPILVQVVIMIVNGNLGTGVAVLGAFSLIRFRSVAGNAKDICTIFFAMVVGLAIGAGYATFAIAVTIVVAVLFVVLSSSKFGNIKSEEREIKITIPEDLDYTNVFDDIFQKYTKKYELIKVKTTNLGSMYKLTYNFTFKNNKDEKQFIDDLRCRNGNLDIVCGRELSKKEEL
ncbi:MAG: DUF4956 domain-containing protein [Bacilli bacterium]|nr:DUF4956 domain-containing protein [Bacilli bacterium]